MRLPINGRAAAGRPFIELAREIEAAILLTVEAGWRFAIESPEVNESAYEVPVTERLRDGMRKALNTGMFEWKDRMIVLPGTETRSHPDVAQPDGLTDISILLIEIFLRAAEHDPHAIIECKRIAENDPALIREYVLQGIDRFRLGKYGMNHSTGFMVGYVSAGSAKTVAEKINSFLSRHGRGAEHLGPSLLIAESWAWRSTHSREVNRCIVLNHVFLSFAKHQDGRTQGAG